LTRDLIKGMMKPSSGRPGDRGPARKRGVEESPHSAEHGAGESPGRGNLSDQGHRNRLPPQGGEGEKAVQETTGVRSNAGGQVTPSGSKAKQGRDAARVAISPG
jgi:hypothetical protein